jgi:hypothetical protein
MVAASLLRGMRYYPGNAGNSDLMSTLIYTEIIAQDSKHFIDEVEF